MRDIRKIKVADFIIEIQGSSFARLIDKSGSFADFMAEGEADFRVIAAPSAAFEDIIPDREQCKDFSFENISCRFAACEGGVLYTMSQTADFVPGAPLLPREEYLVMYWKYGDDFLRVSDGCMSPSMVRFALWMALNILMIPHKCAAIHSSVNVHGQEAVMFLGESGTGKSTHTRLLRERFPSMTLLNDDSPFVRVDAKGKVTVYGSPWSGKTPCYKQLSYPLKALVRLRQAPHNRIYKLNPLSSIGALLPSAPPAFNYVPRMADMSCEFVSSIIESVPLYTLECLPDTAAAELSFSTVFGPLAGQYDGHDVSGRRGSDNGYDAREGHVDLNAQ